MITNFDDIILNRRTCRIFTPGKPTREQVSSVLKTGLHAPYAALALKDGQKFRQFIVVDGSSEKMKKIRSIVSAQTKKLSKLIPLINFIFHNKIPKAFQERIKHDLLGEAPHYVFVIEPKGFPPVAQESIAHCMENMWLKATEIGLGFRLISVFENLGGNKDLLNLLALDKGPYAINCCAIGYPANKLEISVRPSLADSTAWLD